MKKIICVLSSALLVAALPAMAQKINQNDREKLEFVKENTITKTYPASGNKLNIDNSFGNVKFIASTGNEIRVNVHIETSASNKELAEKIFDAITVSDKQQGNEITFKTNIANTSNKDCKNCKSQMNIDYEISLPVTVPLKVSNSFGNTEIPDYTGTVDVTSKFGNLTAGNITNLKNINVEFGKAELKQLSDLHATFKFSEISIGNLSGANKISLEFCSNTSIRLDNNLTSLSLNESYSTVNLRPASSFSANYTISTSFGSFTDRTNSNIKRTDKPDQYGPDSDKSYSGQSGSGAAKVTLHSSFGTIILGEPTADDMKKSNNSEGKNAKRKQVI